MLGSQRNVRGEALSALAHLIGDWIAEIQWTPKLHEKMGGPPTVTAPARFDWVEDAFIMLTTGDRGAPMAQWLIGKDDAIGNYIVFYADDRNSSRIYNMSFVDGLWKMWRDAPGFRQRYEGKVSADNARIDAFWETYNDRAEWELDFKLTYRRPARG